MKRRDLLKLAAAGAVPGVAVPSRRLVQPAVPGITGTPATYIIDYAYDHLDNPSFIEKVAASPPDLLHLGHDVPFTGHWGPRNVPLPTPEAERYRLLSPSATRKRFASLERMLAALRRAGVDILFPYVDNQQMGGDAEKRLGFWEFYDHWEEYRPLGLPPRPPADPIEWLQREPDGDVHFNNPAAYPGYDPQFFYSPCPNNEHWRLYLKFVVEQIAACGYDGLFVDDNILHCYCRFCRQGFQRYLRERYTAGRLTRDFGTDDYETLGLHWRADKTYWAKSQPEFVDFLRGRFQPGELEKRFKVQDLRSPADMNRIGYGFLSGRVSEFFQYLQEKLTPAELKRRGGTENLQLLGIERPQDRLLWSETQTFWAWSIAENLLFLRASAAAVNPDFLMLPNWGAMHTVGAVDGRRVHGKNVAEWKRGCFYLMFEEDWRQGMPGRIAPGLHNDYISDYKFGLINGVRPAVAYSGPRNRAVAELAHAETAAGGGGAWVQSGYDFPEVRKKYRAFYKAHPELFDELEPFGQVAVAFFFNQTHLENAAHLRDLYCLKRVLAREQVLFDYITEGALTRERLDRYAAFLLPAVMYISEAQARLLGDWTRAGGVLAITGDLGSHEENGRPRPTAAFADWFARAELHEECKVARIGRGNAVWAERAASLAPLNQAEERTLYATGDRLRQALANVQTGPAPKAPLAGLLRELTGRRLRGTTRTDVPGLRVNAYRAPAGVQARVVVHLVNYDFSATEEPVAVHDLPLWIPAPRGNWRTARVRALSPDQAALVELAAELDGGYIAVRVPELRIYQVLETVLSL